MAVFASRRPEEEGRVNFAEVRRVELRAS